MGCYATLGRAWEHYDADQHGFQYPHCDGRPILSIYEQLMSMKFAAEIAELSRDQIEGIFWRNAAAASGAEEHTKRVPRSARTYVRFEVNLSLRRMVVILSLKKCVPHHSMD